ncbi:MAG TPA: hypothetical protein VKT30_10190 [Caulobacteraceae bacterium]|nr:hypothetical protein [Caulobacteraceae bacterium]
MHLWPKPALDLDLTRTRDLNLVYFAPAETYLTPYVGRALENSMQFQERIYGWRPWQRTTVLLKDFADYGNAGARAVPNNTLLLEIAPLSQVFETLSAGERFFTLSNHELTHVATMDVWNATDARWRRLLGGKPAPVEDHPESIIYSYLAAPRATTPRWYLEGSAVFMETWMAGGYGRAQGAYDEMVFRAMVRDNARFFSPLGLESEGTQVDFQVGVNDYLYGTRFMSYLALTRSPEKVIQWLRRDDGSAGYYASQFKRVFGAPLDDVWREWIAWEHDFQRANLASVEAYPTTQTRRLSPVAVGSVSRAFYDPATNALIGGFRYPGVIAHVGALSLATGKIRRLADIQGPTLYRVTSLAYDPATHTAWYTTHNDAYRNVMQLDVVSGKTKLLIAHGRIGDLAFNPADRTLWGLRHLNGLVTLVRMDPPYTAWSQVHTFKYGQVLFDLDISPDGTLLSTSFGEINADQSVRVYRLDDLSPDAEPKAIAELRLGQATPEGFVFSPDGRYLYGSAYYTGVSNIYRFELATQKVDAVSNAVTGLFRPIPRSDGSLIAFEYTGQGFAPVSFEPKPLDDLGSIKFLGAEVADQHPVVKTWAVGSPAKIPLDDMVTERGKYAPLHELALAASYPVVEGYKHKVAFGWHAILEDPLELDQLTATVAYSPSDVLPRAEQWHADIEFRTLAWDFRYWHNESNFYDLFGPVDRSRKGDAFIVGYKHPFIYDPPRRLDFAAEAAAYRGLDTLPGAQNVPALADHDIDAFKASLTYSDEDKSLGAVDYERGVRWKLALEDDRAAHADFPQARAELDFGVPLAWKHSSIWLYSAVGVSGGDPRNPLGAFYLGAFGNNWIDDGEAKRYRAFDSFPGFEIDQIVARRFAKALGEWNLPPIRFAELGRPEFYLWAVRPALFAGVLDAAPPVGRAQTFETLGGQLDFNMTVAFRLPMTFSLGYASGFEPNGRQRSEVMASLKILGSQTPQ